MAKIDQLFFVLVFAVAGAMGGPQVALGYGPCDDDEEKFCEKTHQETVKECLHKRLEQLSTECRNYVKSKEDSWSKVRTSWEQVKTSCAQVVKKHCSDLDKESLGRMKALQVCLMGAAQKLDSQCKKELNRHIEEHQPHIKALP